MRSSYSESKSNSIIESKEDIPKNEALLTFPHYALLRDALNKNISWYDIIYPSDKGDKYPKNETLRVRKTSLVSDTIKNDKNIEHSK
jgi:hypothetical protein